jgi:hypothetical protein
MEAEQGALTMSTSIYYKDGKAMCEYNHYVDLIPRLDPTRRLPGIRGVICTHIGRDEVGAFGTGAVECGLLTYFRMQMKGMSVGDRSRAWFTFTPKVGNPAFTFMESTAAQNKMILFLSGRKISTDMRSLRRGLSSGSGT